MAVVSVHQFAQCITSHAWSPNQSMVALCPNNNEVHIYRLVEDKWEKLHVLQKHDQIVSGIDWSARSNRIVTASHDRNSYVWNLEGSEWVPTLVILRLNRAALCVQWSPKENKFAVGSGAKTVCICYYEQENNWWVSKLIRKRHDSSVTSVSWHPNNILLASTSTDGKCRVFSTFIKGVDAKDTKKGTSSDSKFGEVEVEFDIAGFALFLGFLIDRVHHYLQKLVNLRSNAGASKEELENLKKEAIDLKEKEEKASKEIKQLKEELSTLSENLKKMKLEAEEKDKKVETAEAHVASLQKQAADLLLEYDRLLEDNQNLQAQTIKPNS